MSCAVCTYESEDCECSDTMLINGDGVDGLDSANVPVDIWLVEIERPSEEEAEEEEEEEGGMYRASVLYSAGYRWELRFALYLPRKSSVWDDGGRYVSKERAPLAALVEEHIMPFYQNAYQTILEIMERLSDHMYYWEKPEPKEEPRVKSQEEIAAEHGAYLEYTEEQKIAMYEADEFVFPAPPVPHARWDRDAWIRYIDSKGGWRPKR